MAKLPFTTHLWRRLCRMWTTRFWRICRICWSRPKSKNRYRPLGAHKRYRILSRHSTSSPQQQHRYRRSGWNPWNLAVPEWLTVSFLCTVTLPFALLASIFRQPKRKRASSAMKQVRAPAASAHHSKTPSHVQNTRSKTKQQTHISAVTVTQPSPAVIAPKAQPQTAQLTPKSKPKHPSDQFIRQRMNIAGTAYCNKSILERLAVGTYIDMNPEPENPHDRNAIKLTHMGEKIGYIPKDRTLPFLTSLKLGRNVYGVITDISHQNSRTQYEFEAWVEKKK